MDAVLKPFLQSRVNTLLDSFQRRIGSATGSDKTDIEELVRLQAQATTNADVCDDRTAKTGIVQYRDPQMRSVGCHDHGKSGQFGEKD